MVDVMEKIVRARLALKDANASVRSSDGLPEPERQLQLTKGRNLVRAAISGLEKSEKILSRAIGDHPAVSGL
jgi:hypothetical protein